MKRIIVLTEDDFQNEEDDDGQPVEHVVHGGGGEGAPELVSVADLSEGHNRVGHRRADVGAHDDRNSLADLNDCKRNGATVSPSSTSSKSRTPTLGAKQILAASRLSSRIICLPKTFWGQQKMGLGSVHFRVESAQIKRDSISFLASWRNRKTWQIWYEIISFKKTTTSDVIGTFSIMYWRLIPFLTSSLMCLKRYWRSRFAEHELVP